MINVSISVNKAYVYDEVAKTTSYTGAKMQGDDGAYGRIFTTDADRLMLERFWAEACNVVTDKLKPFIVGVNNHSGSQGVELGKNYEIDLELSSSFDESLVNGISSSLFSFFVSAIVSKWYQFTNKGEAESYAFEAAAMMEDVMRKVYYRKKPRRVVPN